MTRTCTVEGCSGNYRARGFCHKHYWRWQTHGTTNLPTRSPAAPTRYLSRRGYWMVYLPGHPMANSSHAVFEHRLVMAEYLGRPLAAAENVHHVNGDKLDNRIENLELWTRSQPAGARVADKVCWAVQLLHQYAPHYLTTAATEVVQPDTGESNVRDSTRGRADCK